MHTVILLPISFVNPIDDELASAHLTANILAALSIILLCGIVTCILLLWRRNVRFRQLSEHHLQGLTTERRLRAQLDHAMQQCKQLETELMNYRQATKAEESGTDNDAQNDAEKTKYANSSLSSEKLQNLFIELEILMRKELIFADPLLSIDKLAQRLNTNRTYLSQAINEMTNDSYSAYVNKFRIDYATILLSNRDNKDSLNQISQKSGFNSSSSFYTIFKKMVGVSPKVFRENIHNMER